jgi:isopentenyldiphosphate isomerase
MQHEEQIIIVDEDNNEVATASRSHMRRHNLPHRAAYILVFNSIGELFVQQRTTWKDIYPGFYDIACGGVVLAGETYNLAAARELAEEMGIRDIPLTILFTFKFADQKNIVWGRAYTCIYDGEIILQPEEVAGGSFLPLNKVLKLAAGKPFTPDGIYLLNRYLKEYAKI